MEILRDFDLSKLNTFGIKAKARFFVEIKNEADLSVLFNVPEFKNNKKLFLGGGSNILFTKDFNGIIVANRLKGIEKTKEDEENVYFRAGGGESWSHFVDFVVAEGCWGAENLALIPGTVGAAPVQNIGAYGVELRDILHFVEAYSIESGGRKIFSNKDCEFGYRDSIFKNQAKDKYFILAATFKFSKKRNRKEIYEALRKYLEENKIIVNSPKEVRDAVVAIRESKLPDPKILGSAGSFFKNVYVSETQLTELQKQHSDIPFFKENEKIKIPTGWLVEQCGWKGKRAGSVGVYEKQALVLVNHGEATGEEVLDLARQIIESVEEKFGLKIEPEVNIV